MNPRRLFWICVVMLTFIGLAACTSMAGRDLLALWEYSDLRLLDPVESLSPTNDIIAVYIRESGEDIQIRLDFLSSANFDNFDLYLAFDTSPGGIKELPVSMKSKLAWDTLMVIPAHGSIEIRDSSGNKRSDSALLVMRDPFLDAILIDLKSDALADHLEGLSLSRSIKLQVFLTSRGNPVVQEWIEPVNSDSAPPAPAQIMLAFWDTFPAYTPATALRRWDGAHTGPEGVRHGLYNLLRTARAFEIPIFLLDANQPQQLSALDYSGGLKLIQEMQQERLLILPDSQMDPRFSPFTSGSGVSPFINSPTIKLENIFGITQPIFSYIPQPDQIILPVQDAILARQPLEAPDDLNSKDKSSNFNSPIYPLRWQEKLVFPFFENSQSENSDFLNPTQASKDGLSVEWKRILIDFALDAAGDPFAESSTYFNLGGDLPATTWGEPQSARATFRWLRDHPWVQVLDGDHLLSMRNGTKETYLAPSPEGEIKPVYALVDNLIEALENAPRNALGMAAIQAYQSLSAPIYPYSPELPSLRSEYAGQVWSILEAAEWADMPTSIIDCSQDPDQDTQPECLLTSSHVYAQFEIDDGSLTFLFISAPNTDFKRDALNQFCDLSTTLGLGSYIHPSAVAPKTCATGIHQFIGPSSQFITGLSDPGQWKPGAGLHSDPAVIPGAFSGPGSGYKAKIINNSLVFSREGSNVMKTYSLNEFGIAADFRFTNSESFPVLQIPLALDPWNLFTPDWADRYASYCTPNQLIWSIQDSISMMVSSSTSIEFSDFQSSRGLFSAPEDPNRENGPGHYLPFPLALVEINGESSLHISIEQYPTSTKSE